MLVLTVDDKKDVTGDASIEWFTEHDWKKVTRYEKKNVELKRAIRSYDERLYRKLGHTFAGGVTMIPGPLGRGLTVGSYRFGRKMIKF